LCFFTSENIFRFSFFNFYFHFIKGVVMNYKKILNVVGVVAVAAVFSIGCSEKPDDEGGNTGSIVYGPSVPCGDKTYKTVKIGNQTWFAENLNYNVEGSMCYDDDPANCAKYGRLYTWEAAKSVCPTGWHLPSDDEWDILVDYAGGSSTAGTKLKSKSGWGNNGNGTDQYGFSALPGGFDDKDQLYEDGGSFSYAEYGGWWWSSDGIPWIMYYGGGDMWGGGHGTGYSVRCVQD
jgi:uncharacterized protein (TIGR02145 family)